MKHFAIVSGVLFGVLITFAASQNCNCKEEDLNYANRLDKLSGDIQNLVREDMYFDSKGLMVEPLIGRLGGWDSKRSSERWPSHGYGSYEKRPSKRSLASMCARVMGMAPPLKRSLSGWTDKRQESDWMRKLNDQWIEEYML